MTQLSERQKTVLTTLDFHPDCQIENCLGEGRWAGTCNSCRRVTIYCQPHLKEAARVHMNGATCAYCLFTADSLTALWRFDRTDR